MSDQKPQQAPVLDLVLNIDTKIKANKIAVKPNEGGKFSVSLTLNGAGYLTSVFVLFLFAVNYNSNLLFTLCFMLIGIMLVSFWLGFSNINTIKSLAVNVLPVHKGQILEYKIEVLDEGRRDHLDLSINDQTVLDLERAQQQQWVLNDLAGERGIRKSSMLRISSCWPLGLFKSARNLIDLPEVVVYPEISDVKSPKKSAEGDDAHHHNDADSLVGLKEYQAGDNARRIDWRSMARRDQLQVKLFDGGSGDASVWLNWDDTSDMPYEQRISSLCRWMLDYYNQNIEFGLRLPDFGAAPSSSYLHVQQCLYQLATLPHQGSDNEFSDNTRQVPAESCA